MRKYLLIAAALLGMGLSPARAADSTVPAMTAASALSGAELFYCIQSAADRKCTGVQISAYIFGLVSGDLTFNGSGVGTITKVNGVSFPSSFTSGGIPYASSSTAISSSAALTANLPVIGGGAGAAPAVGTRSGNTTQFVTTTGTLTSQDCVKIDASGNFVANGSACGSGGGGTPANPTATAGPTAVNGAATTYMRSDAAPAIQKASSSQFGIVEVDGTTLTASAGVISAATLTVVVEVQTGSNYPFVTGDQAKIKALNSASNQVPTIPQAGTAGFAANWFTQVCNIGAGTQTITPTTSTIGGAATFVLPAASAARPACAAIISDGTNYFVYTDFPMDASMLSAGIVAAARGGAGTVNGALKGNGSGAVSQAACADLSNGTALCSTTPGTGVATAAAVALSAAGGLTTTVAAGTSALGTSAISSATCATVVTTSATNTATTDVIQWGFNGDPTAVTGYAPLVAGMLTIIPYPSANNVNFKVCNNTSSSVTPGAITLNWRVAR